MKRKKNSPKITSWVLLLSCNSLQSCRTSQLTLDSLLERYINFEDKLHSNERLRNIPDSIFHRVVTIFQTRILRICSLLGFEQLLDAFYCKQNRHIVMRWSCGKKFIVQILDFFCQKLRSQCKITIITFRSYRSYVCDIYVPCVCILLYLWNFTKGLSTNLLSRREP
jgi:hypothetical protein